jgi:hypothetical protein
MMDKCCMCKRSGEFVDHFSLHCDVASAIWSAFFSRFGLSLVMPTHIVDHLFNCRWSSSRPRSAVVWKMVRTCFFWCVWKDMNDIYFEDRERSLGEILSLFYETLYLWMAAYVSSLSISYSAFLIHFAHAS